MTKKTMIRFLPILLLGFFTQACGSIQIGVATPITENEPVPLTAMQEPTPNAIVPVENESQPTEEPTEDFSHLWVEYWDAKYGYGIALPAHWTVSPTPNDGFGGAMITRSYDDDFFKANAIKGNWINGEPPEGAIKLDFVIFEGIVPEQSLNVAISEILGSDAEVSVVLSIEDTAFGGHSAALITTAPPHNPEDTFTSAAFRLSP
ncbi:MAG: hypothetical protein GY796_04985, partial [Chloroflexi bacterium]|nr:hypothetical protein [Chloroflexota bacterium]